MYIANCHCKPNEITVSFQHLLFLLLLRFVSFRPVVFEKNNTQAFNKSISSIITLNSLTPCSICVWVSVIRLSSFFSSRNPIFPTLVSSFPFALCIFCWHACTLHTLLSSKQTLRDDCVLRVHIIRIVAIWKKQQIKTKNINTTQCLRKLWSSWIIYDDMQETQNTVLSDVRLHLFSSAIIIHMCNTQMIRNVHLLLKSYSPPSLFRSNSRSFFVHELNKFRQIHA